MRILVLDSALARCSAAMVADDAIVAYRSEARTQAQGHETALPVMARDVMAAAGVAPPDTGRGIDLVAVTVGPGSFTGIRAGLALAHGIGLAFGVPVIGVTIGEAIAEAFPQLGDRVLWIVTESRRGHIFLEQPAALEQLNEIVSFALDALPRPAHKVAIAGGAALSVAASLAASGANVMLTDARFALPRHIALVAARRHAGTLPPRAAQPLYVDPPEAHLPRGGLRPPPAASNR
jgi:tRNA threonylcarbamoyladenosine biosynthesis protein TsaB